MKKDELLKNIEKYWTNRAEGYSQVNLEELAGEKWPVWLSVIEEHMPKVERKGIRILDIGTGPGFFSIILSRAGYQVTAIDYTEEMLKKAKNNAGILADKIEWYQMDAQALRFADNTFDMIVSRNVTWNLEHPDRAYYEWMRVLKPGGVLLNFDANYGMSDFTDVADLPENHAHQEIGDEMMRECEEIKRQLPISSYSRPAWDLETLGAMKLQKFQVDLGISSRIYVEKDEFYNPVPIFTLCGKKEG